ncbi:MULTISPECIES: hypothetical protein [Nostoc]|uniref:Uncharacterized protein n=1 Tax=Nostoc paludosum FACHB-159 TaxID=2692908 RepID=A0ABR8K4G2_9NOSO|nr:MULTISPECIES: hypothetical protein [Nostoc]MBD2677673.1 hypothetical protein [Nostoc sp. FACHB-857]MBD2733721.1 hypothetical protein [Nostoc paludosum FACHB-159]
MAMTVEKSLLNNQSILQNFALVEELDEQSAEIISGGYEVFSIRNKTNYNITHILDGTAFLIQPGEEWIYTAYNGGIIEFDIDGRNDYNLSKAYNLDEGRIYEFQDNNYTPGNPYDIDLYYVA